MAILMPSVDFKSPSLFLKGRRRSGVAFWVPSLPQPCLV